MSKPIWLVAYELECALEEVITSVNDHPRPIFTINTPGVEGNQSKWFPRDPCEHDWRFLYLIIPESVLLFECQYCPKRKRIKVEI